MVDRVPFPAFDGLRRREPSRSACGGTQLPPMSFIDTTFGVLDACLSAVHASDDEYVLFGSAVMYLHGIDVGRPPGDVDVFVSRRVWGALLGSTGAAVRTPRADDPPFLEWDMEDGPNLHMFYEWTARDAPRISAAECFASAERVGVRSQVWGIASCRDLPWQCISLLVLRKHKQKPHFSKDMAKHEGDLAILDAHLEATASAL